METLCKPVRQPSFLVGKNNASQFTKYNTQFKSICKSLDSENCLPQ